MSTGERTTTRRPRRGQLTLLTGAGPRADVPARGRPFAMHAAFVLDAKALTFATSRGVDAEAELAQFVAYFMDEHPEKAKSYIAWRASWFRWIARSVAAGRAVLLADAAAAEPAPTAVIRPADEELARQLRVHERMAREGYHGVTMWCFCPACKAVAGEAGLMTCVCADCQQRAARAAERRREQEEAVRRFDDFKSSA
jgi:hypothetical protein